MKFAKNVFTLAGVYGILVMFPMYFAEENINRDHPPTVTHPEFFYGFVGVTLVFQIVFLIISRNPVRYRAIMPAAVLEKVSYVIALGILYNLGRIEPMLLIFGGIDCALAVLFIISYLKTPVAEFVQS